MHKFLIFTNLFLFNSIISFNNFISLRFIDELDTNTTKKKRIFVKKMKIILFVQIQLFLF